MPKREGGKEWFKKLRKLAVENYGKTRGEVNMWHFGNIWHYYFDQGLSPDGALERDRGNGHD